MESGGACCLSEWFGQGGAHPTDDSIPTTGVYVSGVHVKGN